MKIDERLVKSVADNARLNLTTKEIERFVPQLKDILDAFSKIDEVNTENIQPSFQPVKIRNSLRHDKKGDCLTQEQALSLTDHKKDGFFKGPKAV